MKLLFLVIAILINLLNHSFIKSEDKINSINNIVDNISNKEAITDDKT